MSLKQEAIAKLGLPFKWDTTTDKLIGFEDPDTQPSDEMLNQVIAEYTEKERWRILRKQRNQLLAQSDWRMVSDYPGSNQSEWQTYRQALRDITTQTPSLDADGNLTGITWPTAPND